MSEWFPSVVQIENIVKHPNADNLSIATVLGDYPVIIKTDQYQVGDIVGYLPIDTIVPDIQDFYFLCPKAYESYEEDGIVKQRQVGNKYPLGSVPVRYLTIKAKRLRGTFSMGLIVPVPIGLTLGDSIVDVLGLKKLEEEVDDFIISPKMRGANAAPPPKGWNIPYYDIPGVRKYLSCVEKEQDIILTEKLNGCNSSFCYDGEKLWTKSRRYYKKDDPDDMWIAAAARHNLAEKLIKYPMITLFAELVGQVKSFKYNAEIIDGKLNSKLYFFDAYDVRINKYLDYDDFRAIAFDLQLDTTPLLYRGKWTNKEEMYAIAEGHSALNPKTLREGWVLSLGKERFEPRLNGRLKLKYISEGYNLAK